jgi:hypothetical protein
VRPRARRELAEWAQQVHRLSQRRVARLIPVERMTLRYEHHRDPQEALRIRLRELAGSRVRYGYRRLTVLLQREGWEVTHHTNRTVRRFGRGIRQVSLTSDQTWPGGVVVGSCSIFRFEIGMDRDAGWKVFRGSGASAYVYESSSNDTCRVVIECQPVLAWSCACSLDRSDLSLQMSEGLDAQEPIPFGQVGRAKLD